MSRVTHPALPYLGSNSMKRQEVPLLLIDGISLSLITSSLPLFLARLLLSGGQGNARAEAISLLTSQ